LSIDPRWPTSMLTRGSESSPGGRARESSDSFERPGSPVGLPIPRGVSARPDYRGLLQHIQRAAYRRSLLVEVKYLCGWPAFWEHAVNRDQVKGTAKNVAGKVGFRR
jgi:hypothetical protein